MRYLNFKGTNFSYICNVNVQEILLLKFYEKKKIILKKKSSRFFFLFRPCLMPFDELLCFYFQCLKVTAKKPISSTISSLSFIEFAIIIVITIQITICTFVWYESWWRKFYNTKISK